MKKVKIDTTSLWIKLVFKFYPEYEQLMLRQHSQQFEDHLNQDIVAG